MQAPQEFMDFPSGSVGKASPCYAGPGVRSLRRERSPGEGNGYPLQYSGLENSMGSLVGYSSWESQRVGHDWASSRHTHRGVYSEHWVPSLAGPRLASWVAGLFPAFPGQIQWGCWDGHSPGVPFRALLLWRTAVLTNSLTWGAAVTKAAWANGPGPGGGVTLSEFTSCPWQLLYLCVFLSSPRWNGNNISLLRWNELTCINFFK